MPFNLKRKKPKSKPLTFEELKNKRDRLVKESKKRKEMRDVKRDIRSLERRADTSFGGKLRRRLKGRKKKKRVPLTKAQLRKGSAGAKKITKNLDKLFAPR